jgi:hypothetical protein
MRRRIGILCAAGCRPGSECVFYQDGKGRFDFKPTVKAP